MEFKIGDKVVVCSKTFTQQNGLIGEVVGINPGAGLPIHIRYDEGQDHHPYMAMHGDAVIAGNTYDYDDIILGDFPPNMEDTRSYLEVVTK